MTEWINGIAKLTLPTPFAVGDVNAFLINGPRLTLVDCGPKTEDAWNSLQHQLDHLMLTPDDIQQVILTHHHPDHVGLLDFLPKTVEVFGHYLNERWLLRSEQFLKEHDDFYKKLFVEFGIPDAYFPYINQLKKTLRFSCNRSLTGTLQEDSIVPGLVDWQIIFTPGHALSHISLFRESDGVLIGGDHILAHISPNPLLEPPYISEEDRPKPLIQYNQSLKKLLQYPIQKVYTGHGEEVYNLPQLIDKRLKKQHERAMAVKEFLKEGPLSVFEICKRLFPTVYEKEFSLTISETVGQLDYLLDIEEIDQIKDQQKYLYSAR
ncbi:MBL fold metallo-hydrolase [Bacillus sp. CGMCC 1.16607]|uniref:MBL fold metallo-hydrolase n=1 Tax=Bacillus sp. CGMCC 1.16607 TaxID=3351842 RepID=UPI0036354CB0